MPSSTHDGVVRRLVRDGWWTVPVVIGAFLLLHQMPGRLPLIARQFVYLVPPVVAFIGCLRILRIAPPSDERTAWGLMGVSIGLLALGEVYYSCYQVFVSPGGPPFPSWYDALTIAAAVALTVTIVFTTGFRRLPVSTRLRMACDAAAMAIVGYVGVYALWSRLLAGSGLPWNAIAWRAAYSFAGLCIGLGALGIAAATRSRHDREIVWLVAGSLSIFSLGVIFWPLWPGGEGDPNSLAGAADSAFMLLGYLLIMMATVRRIALADRGWRVVMGRATGRSTPAWTATLSALVLTGSLAMGARAFTAAQSRDEMLFLAAAGSIAIMALVARTTFSTAEMGELRGWSARDPVSGAYNHRAFQEACEQRLLLAWRRGVPFAVTLLDLDGFDDVNVLLGHAAGDRALRTVVEALDLAGGRSARVYRLTSDEFAVIGTGIGTEQATAFGTALMAGVAGVEPAPGLRLSASVGVVASETGTERRDELIRRADAAQIWAKYHGKGQVVLYDPDIVRALGAEERVRLHEEQSFLGVARALAAAADTRDPGHRYHSRNVAALAVLLAEASGLDPRDVQSVEIAAMLHDVGRIAMPDDVTTGYHPDKPDSRLEQEHVELGRQLVESIGIERLGEGVRAHHEWWDGTGYPDGLAGDSIPVAARIIALADAYDGMTSGRRGGYRLSKSSALQEIDRGIGARFDPELAERFIELVGSTPSLGWTENGIAS